MADCKETTISDAAFFQLTGILVLNMAACKQPTVTDAAFVHQKGIQ